LVLNIQCPSSLVGEQQPHKSVIEFPSVILNGGKDEFTLIVHEALVSFEQVGKFVDERHITPRR
jgi:hypothetical protein